jgi:endonuclease YncB( thermonuclease family)
VTRLLVVLTALACAAVGHPASARAASGPCTADAGSPRCQYWYGKATFVADGDTIDVRVRGLGVRRVRLTGINAMEQTRYSRYRARRRGACHAVAATARLEQLIRSGRRRVRLAAQDPASVAGRRLRRQVSARIDGRWVDVGRVLVEEGHALWLPHGVEYAWNHAYRTLSQAAAARRLRVFDPRGCGPGPDSEVQPRLQLRWDARGNDGANVNGEWAQVTNPASRPIALGGWSFRDSSARRFTFPRGTVVPAGGSVRIHVGRGTTGERRFYWGLPGPAFENPTGGRRAMGDGGYLFDPRGNLRAAVIYPGAGRASATAAPSIVVIAAVTAASVVVASAGALARRHRG